MKLYKILGVIVLVALLIGLLFLGAMFYGALISLAASFWGCSLPTWAALLIGGIGALISFVSGVRAGAA